MSILIRRKIALTVNSGAAFIFGAPGLGEPKPKTPIDRAIDAIVGALASVVSRKFASAEQNQRNKELEEKSQVVIKRALERRGRKANEMMLVMVLATDPSSRDTVMEGNY